MSNHRDSATKTAPLCHCGPADFCMHSHLHPADDWVSVPNTQPDTDTNEFAKTTNTFASKTTPPDHGYTLTPSDFSDDALLDYDQCDFSIYNSPNTSENEQHTSPIPTNLTEEIHLARMQARQAEQKLLLLENLVKSEQDPVSADCTCTLCAPCLARDEDAKSEASDASSDVPAIVEEYFELDREAFVRDERLLELEQEFRESEAARRRDCDTSDLASAVEDEAVVEYKRQRQELSEALAIAHYRLHVRRRACLAQGFDPESFRYRRT